MTRKHQKYTDEFKRGAVNMVLKEKMTCSDVRHCLGTSGKNISRWVKLHQNSPPYSPEKENVADLNKKIILLEKENRRLQMEREILKKAAAFFANESK